MTLKQFKRIVNSIDEKHDNKEILFGIADNDNTQCWKSELEYLEMEISDTIKEYIYIVFKEC